MSAPPTETLIHYVRTRHTNWTGCKDHVYDEDQGWRQVSEDPARVTCFACRKSEVFKQAQLLAPLNAKEGVGTPTPLAEVIAADPDLSALQAEAEARTTVPRRNLRGMYVIEETIHHGSYRSTRRIEVYAINVLTVDAILQSSAYAYGSWQNPENPAHTEVRRTQLRHLVEDLKAGRENKQIGWSTFRTIK
jgi:hypothetical protein